MIPASPEPRLRAGWLPRVRVRRHRSASLSIGVVIVIILALVAVAAPILSPYDPEAIDLSHSLAAPGGSHLLGTDGSGHDTLSRLIWGARSSLVGPLLVVIASTIAGVVIGVTAGWLGGWIDSVVSRLIDVAFAFPGLIVAILTVSLFGTGLTAPVVALSIAYTPWIARSARGATVVERERPYIAACLVQGMSPLRICVRHVLPNAAPVLAAQAAINFGYVLIDLAALSFLGLGVQPPNADWGLMISDGQGSIASGAPEQALFACLTVFLAVISFNVIADALSEAFAGDRRR
jgi:peptide/nickel transport system permease protein